MPMDNLLEGRNTMRFYIVDDDQAVRSVLGEIIEDEEFGEVVDRLRLLKLYTIFKKH